MLIKSLKGVAKLVSVALELTFIDKGAALVRERHSERSEIEQINGVHAGFFS